MMDMNEVNFEDLFQFSPEPPPSQEQAEEATTKQNLQYSSQYVLPDIYHPQPVQNNVHNTVHNNVHNDLHSVQQQSRVHQGSAFLPINQQHMVDDEYGRGRLQVDQADRHRSSQSNISQSLSSDSLKVKQLWEELPVSDSGSGGEEGSLDRGEGGERRGRRGRGGDPRYKLERSRQSARECRARKKLRYQYLDDMILEREKANTILRLELEKYVSWCRELDQGRLPDGWNDFINSSQIKQEAVAD